MDPHIQDSALSDADDVAQHTQKLSLNEGPDSTDSTFTHAHAVSSSPPLTQNKSASTLDQCNCASTKNNANNADSRENGSICGEASDESFYKDNTYIETSHKGESYEERTAARSCKEHNPHDETSDNEDGGASITTPNSSVDLSVPEQDTAEADGVEHKTIETIPRLPEEVTIVPTTMPLGPASSQPLAPVSSQPLTPPEPPTTTSMDMMFTRAIMNKLQFSSNYANTKPRSQSSSTRDVSRFFPTQQTDLDPQAVDWQQFLDASVFGTSISPVSSGFPEGLTGFNLPPLTFNSENTTSQPRTTSGSSGDSQSPQHNPADQAGIDQPVHNAGAQTAAQSLQAPSVQNTSFHDSCSLLEAHSNGNLQVSPVLGQALSPGIPSISRLTSPSLDHQFLPSEQPKHIGSNLQVPTPTPNGARVPAATWISQTSHALPPFPRGSTNIENLEKVADGSEAQKALSTTRPASSWVTNLPDWRSKGPARGNGCDGIRNIQPFPPITCFSHDNVVAAPEPAGFQPQATTTFVRTHGAETSQALVSAGHDYSSISGGTAPPRPHKPFKPMNSILYPDASKQPLSKEEVASREEKGISMNYQGNPHNPKNRSADIPDTLNCALFLTNLPAKCTYQDLLQALAQYRVGRVWSTYINPPRIAADQNEQDQKEMAHKMGQGPAQVAGHTNIMQPDAAAGGRLPLSYSTSAAKVIFYHPLEAQHLLALGERGDFRIRGRRITVKYNRHKTPAQVYENPTSRVLLISGPASIVYEEQLKGLYAQYFEYQTEEVIVVAEGNDWRVLEWRFGSMRAQAHSAYQLLKSLYPGVVSVKWAVDPCAGYMVVSERQPPEGQLLLETGDAGQ